MLKTRGHKLAPPRRAKLALPPKHTDSFYLSPEWRTLMDDIVRERFGSREVAHCEDPLCRSPWRRGIRIFGDHIDEVKDGGAKLDKRNVLCRCGSCHSRVTAERRAARLAVGG